MVTTSRVKIGERLSRNAGKKQPFYAVYTTQKSAEILYTAAENLKSRN